MLLLKTALAYNADPLLARTPVFRVDVADKLTVHLRGTFGGTVTMQFCPTGPTGTFNTFKADGVDQTFTAEDMRSYSFNGEGWFRFQAATGVTSVDVYVGGLGVAILP